MEKKKIVRTDISIGGYGEFIDEITELSREKKSSYVCFINVHSAIEAKNDNKFAEIINFADIAAPDGMPIAKSIELLYGIKQERIAGMDLFPVILKKAAEENLSVFLYGSTDFVLGKIAGRIKSELPDLKIAGLYSPPFRNLSETEKNTVAAAINDSGCNLVFVALGCPKQEIWMAEMKGRVNAVMLGVGGAFPVYAGIHKRAYGWMRNLSLEWLFRLIQEPKRLLWRYIYTDSIFLFLMSKEIINIKILKRIKKNNNL